MATVQAKGSAAPIQGAVSEVKIFAGGKWQSSTAKRWGEVFNPSSGKVIAKVPLCGADNVDRTSGAMHPVHATAKSVMKIRLMTVSRPSCVPISH